MELVAECTSSKCKYFETRGLLRYPLTQLGRPDWSIKIKFRYIFGMHVQCKANFNQADCIIRTRAMLNAKRPPGRLNHYMAPNSKYWNIEGECPHPTNVCVKISGHICKHVYKQAIQVHFRSIFFEIFAVIHVYITFVRLLVLVIDTLWYEQYFL